MALALTPDDRLLYVNYQHSGPGGRLGHDAIGKFDAKTGAFLGSITGLANVGAALAVSPDGQALWANGLDACMSRAYDHVGCPAVPAGIVNVINTRTDKLVHSIAWLGPVHPLSIEHSPDARIVAVSGESPRFYDSGTYEIVAALPAVFTRALVFDPDGRRAYTSLQRNNQVAVLELNRASR
jgi:DNA-binding beta-propeller fold protein YncE